MADFDFLDGFDADGDWGFTSVKSKPATESKAESEATKEVVKTTADNVGKAVSSEIINRLESKLDKLLRATNETKETVVAKNETELEIAKKQMDDEYDLRKDNLGKEYKDSFKKLEKLIIPLLIKLAKSPEAYIHWPNRAEVIEAQLKKIKKQMNILKTARLKKQNLLWRKQLHGIREVLVSGFSNFHFIGIFYR